MDNNATEPTGTGITLVSSYKHLARRLMPELWDLFIERVERHTFTDKERLVEGKRVVNLLGSKEIFRKLFFEAADELFSQKDQR